MFARRIGLQSKTALAILCVVLVSTTQLFAATVATDTSFYASGETVTISGTVYWANESVQLRLVHSDGTPVLGYSPWTALANSTGRFVTLSTAPYDVSTPDTLLVEATGLTSGATATSAFVVGIGTDLDQLQNGTMSATPNWANGNINNTNSCYEEANSVPYRYFITGSTGGTSHFFTINFEWTKNSIHAIDYLTSYDLTEGGPIATAGGPCGSPNSPPGDCATPTGTYPIPNPLVLANYTGTIPSDFFTTVNPGFVLDGPGNFRFYNATIDSIGKYFFTGTATNRELNVKVYFKTVATGSVGFFWGGHLSSSAPSAWGTGMASGSVSGAPFHMRAKDLDAGGGANQDRSIQNGAVCLPPDANISCTPMDTVCTTLSYSCSALSGAASYTWSVTGGTINSGQGTNTINYTVTGSAGGSVTLTLEACNSSTSCAGSFCCAWDTVVIPIKLCNVCPVANCHGDTSVFLCASQQICIPGFSCTDADGNLTSCVAVGGTLVGNTICFTPTVSGVYPLKLIATDSYGCADTCVTNVTVTINSAPVVQFGADTTFTLCTGVPICRPYTVTDPNGNVTLEQLLSGPGTIDTVANTVCFTPSVGGSYTFIVKATDACGLTDQDTIVVTVNLNSPPVATNPPASVDTFICAPATICRQFSATDANGNGLTWALLSGSGTVSATGEWCFSAGASGSYCVTATVSDPCGAKDTVSMCYNVTVNAPPVVLLGNDTSIFQCVAAPICVPYTVTDANGNVTSEVLFSGTGTIDTIANTVCFTPSVSGTNTIIVKATDACGASDQDTIVINVGVNVAPVVQFGNDSSFALCTTGQICLPYTVTDANNNVTLEQLLTGTGTIDTVNNRVCFTPATTGTYTFIVKATDACGLTDQDTIVLNLTVNVPPVATNPPASVDTLICAPATICRQFSATDANGNGLVWALLSGNGTVSASGLWCFNATASGSYCVWATVTDPCGAKDTVSMCYNVTVNTPPVVLLGNDTSIFQCVATQICVPYSVTDANGNVTSEVLFSGTGTIDTVANTVCFTPSVSGTNTIIVKVTDACGAFDQDTIVITVGVNVAPVVQFGADTTFTMCTPVPICRPYTVTDPNGNVTLEQLFSGPGTIDTVANTVCFTPSVGGLYTFIVKATDACGLTDQDTIVVTVNLNSPPVATNPPASVDTFMCAPATICRQFSATDVNGNGLVWALLSGSGTVSASGLWCFNATTSGSYCVSATVTDPCGAKDTVSMCYNVTINTPPVATNPPASIDTFICAPATICRQFAATDANGNGLVWAILSGSGTVSASGQWCFSASASGSYCVSATVADPCGAKDTVSICYNVTINQPPVATNPPASVDTFICAPATICRQFSATDANGNGLTWALLSGSGTVSPTGLWCFNASASGSFCVSATVADPCGAKDTVLICYNVTVNSPPAATNPPAAVDTFICGAGATICRQFTATDPNGNGLVWAILSGSGTVSPTGVWCFTPSGSGNYCVTATVADPCGAKDTVSMCYNVVINTPPVVTNPQASVDTFLCTPAQICHQFVATDANGNGLVWAILSGSGTVSPTGLWCFNAGVAGSFCVSATVTDPCGAKDTVSMCYNVTINTPPVATNPPATVDTSICAPAQICRQFSATDANGNGLTWAILTGSGTVSPTGLWCFNANATGSFCVTATVSDPCGTKDTVNICYNVIVNVAPIVQFGPDRSISLCSPAQQCETYTVSDGNGLSDIVSEVVVSAPVGTILDTVLNRVCYTPAVSGTYTFIVRATDKCGATDQDTVVLNVTVNVPPVVTISAESVSALICLGVDSAVCVSYTVTDPEGGVLTEVLESGTATIDTLNNTICLAPNANGVYQVVVLVADACGTLARDTAVITVNRELCCPTIAIEKKHNVIQGGQTCVDITMQGRPFIFGGFDFLIAYDASAMSPLGVNPGQLYPDCQWEYFTYRFGANGNCGSACPSGLIKITGVAETNNGAYHPTCFGPSTADTTQLASICFLVSNDRTLECQFAPIRFFWIDCSDNALSSKWGDSLFISDEIYDYDNTTAINDGLAGFPTFFGAQNSCILSPLPGKPPASRCLDFYNGGIDIICADSIDARGDINLNGLSYEVADAVMFSNYFIIGLSAFAGHVDGSSAASDVNADGIPLTVSDLVYLIRVIVGDASPIPKGTDLGVSVVTDGGRVSISGVELGAVFMILKGNVTPVLITDARMQFGFDGTNTRVLVHAPFDVAAFGQSLKGFSGDILNVNAEIVHIEMADVYGYAVKTTLPTEYLLSQNYPNPFNPSTRISYDLPVAASVTLQVYDLLGQVVTTLVDAAQTAGTHSIEWNGRDKSGKSVASGVYFYRLSAGSYSATKKMVLLK